MATKWTKCNPDVLPSDVKADYDAMHAAFKAVKARKEAFEASFERHFIKTELNGKALPAGKALIHSHRFGWAVTIGDANDGDKPSAKGATMSELKAALIANA